MTIQYITGSKTLTSYLVPGSPYLTFAYDNATPIFISEQGPILSFNDKPPAKGGITAKLSRITRPHHITSEGNFGTKFKVTTRIGTYVIYSLSGPISLSASQDKVVASSPFTGVIRMVKLSDPAHERILNDYAGTYPKSVDTGFLYSSTDSTAILRFTWSVVGNSAELLMMTWPHHRYALFVVMILTSYSARLGFAVHPQNEDANSNVPSGPCTQLSHDERIHVSRSWQRLGSQVRPT